MSAFERVDIVLVRCRILTDRETGVTGKYGGQINPPFGVLYIQSYLKKAGFKVIQLDPAIFGKKKTHVDKVTLLPFHYGLHLGLDVPEDDLYRILLAIEKNVAALAKVDKAFKQIEKDMPGMQRRGVEAAANLVPIHPGLAKYMRAKGVWDSKWDSRIAKAE